jgi:hypothetical protein
MGFPNTPIWKDGEEVLILQACVNRHGAPLVSPSIATDRSRRLYGGFCSWPYFI